MAIRVGSARQTWEIILKQAIITLRGMSEHRFNNVLLFKNKNVRSIYAVSFVAVSKIETYLAKYFETKSAAKK